MDENIYKIAIAALLHDVGKFMQRAELEKDVSEIKENYAEFCPDERTHLHAARTAYFIQHFIPDGFFDKTELYKAAHHHVSGPGEIYREADCLSSGMERNSRTRDVHRIINLFEGQERISDKKGLSELEEDFSKIALKPSSPPSIHKIALLRACP